MSTQHLTQKAETSIMDVNLVSGLKTFLKNWSPTNKAQAVRMLSFLSTVSNEAISKRIKSECYNFLLGRCANCENAIDPETGLEVVKVEKNTKVYNTNETIEALEVQISELKKKLEEEREKAGVNHSVTTVFYKTKN